MMRILALSVIEWVLSDLIDAGLALVFRECSSWLAPGGYPIPQHSVTAPTASHGAQCARTNHPKNLEPLDCAP
ncbi:hypothetical protein BS50DRAFT_643106 [Corynespora cassiicola Philippines]|uniref:Uncharacterized protein n=1 Tax=Corynespora cassiicola Philippines TaxID=1448308 RepID=A0A2T2PAK4_CORCC|nr:hypothetical protein BS50DRAFT_643106 [Corynespora cassiicola Philippines]